MKAIKKGTEPKLLIKYRLNKDAIYDGPNFTAVKNKIRASLLKEQGYICAYCMRRISADTMKIEHWQCQANFSDLQLEYKNMLGCCNGNEGNPPALQTCDTRKGNSFLSFSPANADPDIESKIAYTALGLIFSREEPFNTELNEVLNLNQTRLMNNRKAAIAALNNDLAGKKGRRTRVELEHLLAKYSTPTFDGKLKEYSGVIIYNLRKKISKV